VLYLPKAFDDSVRLTPSRSIMSVEAAGRQQIWCVVDDPLQVRTNRCGEFPLWVKAGNTHDEQMFSALLSTADIGERDWHVSDGPRPDIRVETGALVAACRR
jgi:hypothetical protein